MLRDQQYPTTRPTNKGTSKSSLVARKLELVQLQGFWIANLVETEYVIGRVYRLAHDHPRTREGRRTQKNMFDRALESKNCPMNILGWSFICLHLLLLGGMFQ